MTRGTLEESPQFDVVARRVCPLFQRAAMTCRLSSVVLSLTLLVIAAGTVQGQPNSRPPRSGQGSSGIARTATIHWENVPLREAVARLADGFETSVFVDRRLDPRRRLRLHLEDATLQRIVEQVAVDNTLGVSQWGSLVYLGPATTTEDLKLVPLTAVAAQRGEEIAQLPDAARRMFFEEKAMAWPRLTVPRDLIVGAIRQRGWHVRGETSISHDLWPAGTLPALPFHVQLTVLLIGFDQTFRVLPNDRTIEIVPFDVGQQPRVPAGLSERFPGKGRQAAANTPLPTRQVYTLSVQEQPVGDVLRMLANRLEWQLEIDQAAIRAAGLSLDRRVSFAVENADEDALFEALLEPAGLTVQRAGDRRRIIPR